MDIFNPAQIHSAISKPMTGQQDQTLSRKIQGVKSGMGDLNSVSKDFEAIFIHNMLQAMRAGVPKSGLLDSFSMDMFQSMFDEEVANEMAKGQGIGLAKMLETDLTTVQEKIDNSNYQSDSAKPETLVTIDLRGEK